MTGPVICSVRRSCGFIHPPSTLHINTLPVRSRPCCVCECLSARSRLSLQTLTHALFNIILRGKSNKVDAVWELYRMVVDCESQSFNVLPTSSSYFAQTSVTSDGQHENFLNLIKTSLAPLLFPCGTYLKFPLKCINYDMSETGQPKKQFPKMVSVLFKLFSSH